MPELGSFQVTRLPLALPWETGLVLVSARRADFPTAMETHLLRVAVSQAAIAIHTARRLAREHAARSVAEAALLRQNELLRSLVDDVEPSLASIAGRIRMRRASSRTSTRCEQRRNPRLIGVLRVQLPGERMPRTRGPPRSR